MLLSIIMPAHNAAAYLERTLALLAQQIAGLEQVEVVAIDDASTDETAKILVEFARTYSWLKTISVDFANVGQARLAGMELVEGRYITFLDSDDAFLPGGLAWMVEALLEHEPDLLMTPLWETNQPLSEFEDTKSFARIVPLSNKQACDLFCEHKQLQGHFIGKCVSRRLLEQYGLVSMKCYEDMATTPYWISKAKSILWGETPVYAYYKRPGSLSDRGQTWRYGEEYIRALQSMETAFFGRVELWQTAHLWIGFAKDLLKTPAGRQFLAAQPAVAEKIQSISIWRYLVETQVSCKWKMRFLRVRLRLQ
ncbi:glycosyltransferase family 2 protein [Chromobacterium violaceum]|uniref:Chondroitin polymerase n=1 Tax=Chromobacterium violaceum TaxID=536 RepID=A0AAX2MGH5_CHRVL|nr:glycosyltransferase family A protein [Chromobacterium violaceum]OLZ87555.1 hypothetical protein BS642_00100 [Chromobacterium violaceum]STB69307.1 Chondroitin polymerase [Chromobacterium violaceum]SUY93430.1 Chondroitin polymerase [Chromobacterium violaceum]